MAGLSPFWKTVIRRVAAVALAVLVLGGWPTLAQASPETNPTPVGELFEIHCAGCHAGGGNIIRRGKTLKPKALKRNGMDSEAAIATLISQGKGVMPAFSDRLSEADIAALAEYVLQQAEAGW